MEGADAPLGQRVREQRRRTDGAVAPDLCQGGRQVATLASGRPQANAPPCAAPGVQAAGMRWFGGQHSGACKAAGPRLTMTTACSWSSRWGTSGRMDSGVMQLDSRTATSRLPCTRCVSGRAKTHVWAGQEGRYGVLRRRGGLLCTGSRMVLRHQQGCMQFRGWGRCQNIWRRLSPR